MNHNNSVNLSRKCNLYLMRHGDSRQDKIQRFVGRTDLSLNERGKDESRWWQYKLAKVHFDKVVCSTLIRSIETAQIIMYGRTCDIEVVPEFVEIDLGSWDGLPVEDIRHQFPNQYEERGTDLARFRPPGGESFKDLEMRVLPAYTDILNKADKNILVVGHAGSNRVILCHLLGMPLSNLFRIGQDYGCLNMIEYTGNLVLVRGINIRPVTDKSGCM